MTFLWVLYSGMISRVVAQSSSSQHRRAPVGARRKRGPSVPLKGKVSPEHRRLAELGADARGISLARYMELLIEQDDVARWMKEIEDAEQATQSEAQDATTPLEEPPA
jgi:hypothetical protein